MSANRTYQSLKGFRDILPEETQAWQWVEGSIRDLMCRYGYGEVRLPVIEATELFARGVGEGTDIVGKEMYSFLDKSEPPESITLRPELTAGAARAFIEHSLGQVQPLTRWYYLGPLFRYEQPQAGRFRQFHQFGIELIGSPYPEADVEVISAGANLLSALGIQNFRLRLNSLGTLSERLAYRQELLVFLHQQPERLSEESRRRMERNPLRVLDSKKPEDIAATAEAPRMLDFLGNESRTHFQNVCGLLDDAGIAYHLDHRLVRGLDYYSQTTFEFQGLDLGAQDALCGGGRYDTLIEQLGGKPTPAVGLSFGLERLLIALESAGKLPASQPDLNVYLIALDEDSRRWASSTAYQLRTAGLSVEHDLLRRSMKAQMREANKHGARHVVIVGENELAAGEVQVKQMQTHEQRSVRFDDLAVELGLRT